ncbi:HNH endonuclease [Arachnia propionica]|uniref:HNH endonuclease n=1 Tax=Arachnia propionica TaxID=1750 RepID=A0A3P1T7L7_9ACTN|nr:HNH endonuclease [Arachnia propionica]RRD05389.1 HNH endonuclease [Arachnia propionica]
MALPEIELREAAMRWLDAHPSPLVDFTWLTSFEFDGVRIPLVDRVRGIRAPKGLGAALSIKTVHTPDGENPPYEDTIGPDGLQRYKYQGTDPEAPDNVALRRAMLDRLPLIWFVGVAKARYQAIYPVHVIGDDPARHEFTLALDAAQRDLTPGMTEPDRRAWAERITKQRLHQPVFRARVLLAYEGRCSICRLRHTELLDAAHIIEDGLPRGNAVVPNGISLCKIHHAAYDANILGIRPDLTLHVRDDVLAEQDGWMLAGGIQGVHGKRLEILPRARTQHPDPSRLEERYARFLMA